MLTWLASKLTSTSVSPRPGYPAYVVTISTTTATVTDLCKNKYGLSTKTTSIKKSTDGPYAGYFSGYHEGRSITVQISYPSSKGGVGYLRKDDGGDPADDLETFTLDNGLWELGF